MSKQDALISGFKIRKSKSGKRGKLTKAGAESARVPAENGCCDDDHKPYYTGKNAVHDMVLVFDGAKVIQTAF